ncbi:MAG: MerR family transcriptional regulator [Clostridia bacterium]|nr:MerR family transcriptional regulator [Clostridia bacterium]
MKMQIKKFAELTGVSVRTLHYYDEIGLLKPSSVDRFTGYRYYDESSVLRMQEILFYRELDFSLKSIAEILSSPNYDREKALKEQKKLLTLKKERLERLILSIDNAVKGENVMSAFDNSEFEAYKAEAKEKWGNTKAYAEFNEKTKAYSKERFADINTGLEYILRDFAELMKSGAEPDSSEAQALVKKLQDYITENYYTCTDEILAGLGQMYVADERFKDNIDKYADGTAEFASKAIRIYCE